MVVLSILFLVVTNTGGADCLIMIIMPLYIGVNALYAILIAVIVSIPYSDACSKQKKNILQKNQSISNSDILYMRKLVRIGSNVKIPGDSHYKNKKYCSCFSKKIEMRKMTMPNFCINFLNKAAKSLPILYDFAVASLADAWIKMLKCVFKLCS